MNRFNWINAPSYFLEFGPTTLRILNGDSGLDLPLERLPEGWLTPACKSRVAPALQDFMKKAPWHGRSRVFCAINARGVSLRQMTLPASSQENIRQVLALRIEAEFPLGPDQLAWGWRALNHNPTSDNGTQDYLIAAVRKEVVEDYADLFNGSGVTPLFTLSALAREALCTKHPRDFVVLDIGHNSSEIAIFQNGQPTTVRVLSWGGENITSAIAEDLKVSRPEADRLKMEMEQGAASAGGTHSRIQTATTNALAAFAATLNGYAVGHKVFLTGRSSRQPGFASSLSSSLGSGTECVSVEPLPGPGRSASAYGLRLAVEGNDGIPPMILEVKPGASSVERFGKPTVKRWIKPAAWLLSAALLLPTAEALLLKPFLANRLAAIKADKSRLGDINRELDFLQYLKQNQSPYLDTLAILAKCAPQGARFDSVAMNRRGELSWKGSMRDGNSVAEFRSKLIATGFFATVTVEEQNPTQDRQKVNIRMSAHWAAASDRATASAPTMRELDKSKSKDATPSQGGPAKPPLPELNKPTKA